MDTEISPGLLPADAGLRSAYGNACTQTHAVILKRLCLAILPALREWSAASRPQNTLALKTLDEIARNHDLYDKTVPEHWAALLESFLHPLTIEVHIWKRAPEIARWLHDPAQIPFLGRAEELAQNTEALMIGWHRQCGIMAAELHGPGYHTTAHCPGFPKVRTFIQTPLSATPALNLHIWAWNAKNFIFSL